MTERRLWLTSLGLLLVVVLLAPAMCSQSSDDVPRCETVFGYSTPFGEWVQALLIVALILCVIAVFRRRRARR